MILEDSFHMPLPIDDAWQLLTDLERVVPCVPGASFDEVVDGEHRGSVTTRIGPISASYTGAAWFLERDEVDHRAVIALRGRERGGNGSVSAQVTTELATEGSGTQVGVRTDLAVSGRAAQFGRSLLADVSKSLMAEFASRLEALARGGSAAHSLGVGAEQPAPPAATSTDLDAWSLVAWPLVRRAVLPLAAALAGLGLGWLLGRALGQGDDSSTTPD